MMRFFADTNWLFWSVPLTVIGLVLLLTAIFKLVTTIQRAEILRVPLTHETTVAFEARGDTQIHWHGPRFTNAFSGLTPQLYSAITNQVIPISRSLVPIRSSGIGTIKLSYGNALIPEPGTYVLRVSGLQESRDYTRCGVVFTHPYTLTAVAYILGIVISNLMFVGGLVMSFIWTQTVR